MHMQKEGRPKVPWNAVMFIVAMVYALYVFLNLKLRRKSAALAIIPIMPLFLYLPSLPASCHVRTMLAIPLLWIAPSKLALLAFNAPLDPLPWLSSGFMPFCASTLLPIRILAASPWSQATSASRTDGIGFLVKFVLLVAVLNVYPLFPDISLPLLYVLYCIHFYLGLELAFIAVANFVEIIFRVTACSQFDQPYLAESLSEFWGRRWNLTVHGLLKATVYRPVLKLMGAVMQKEKGASGGHRDERKLKMTAAAATFAMSGAVHELVYVYVSKSRATGEMATFFLVHGAATIAEGAYMSRYRQLPRRLRHFLTLAFVYVTASLFFMTPLRRAGIDEDAIAEYHRLQSAFVSLVVNAWKSCKGDSSIIATKLRT